MSVKSVPDMYKYEWVVMENAKQNCLLKLMTTMIRNIHHYHTKLLSHLGESQLKKGEPIMDAFTFS